MKRLVCFVQGSSYVLFAMWALLARDNYARRHDLEATGWILNAHAIWMLIVGGTLVEAATRDEISPAIARLGFASAVGLAANDGALRDQIAPVYSADLLFELGLAACWLTPTFESPRT